MNQFQHGKRASITIANKTTWDHQPKLRKDRTISVYYITYAVHDLCDSVFHFYRMVFWKSKENNHHGSRTAGNDGHEYGILSG